MVAHSSSSSSSTSSSPRPLHPPSSVFTPIQECEEDELSESKSAPRSSSNCTDKSPSFKHYSTPREDKETTKPKSKKLNGREDGSVLCNKCRPHVREKTSVVPISSPNAIFKSIFSSLTRKSPKSIDAREDQLKVAVTEISHKLIQATKRRDEAVLEASRVRHSMTELERKLNKLEIYCHDLKSGLDEYSGNANSPNHHQSLKKQNILSIGDKSIDQFLVAVSDSRSSVRILSRSLTLQLKNLGTKVYERISLLLQPYGIKIPVSRNPKSVLFYLEALLNKTFFEDFEATGFQQNSTTQILNPMHRCESNYSSYTILKQLTWEEVLNKGTRHFSEEFSKFCDRKMSKIVSMLNWNRAWPEPLLKDFFCASKSIWLVHLLANSVHPSLPIFRVHNGGKFESGYMEDMGEDRANKLVPTMVRIMVAPGFYVFGNVVKCKVLCRYHNNISDNND